METFKRIGSIGYIASSIIFILFSLAGCVSHSWVSSTKGLELLDRDIANCRVWSYEKFPPLMRENVGINYPLSTSQTTYVNPAANAPGISVQTEDVNIQARELAFKKCMMDNDWRWVAN